jgi:hypothetical protein
MKYLVVCDHAEAIIEQETPEQAKLLLSCPRCTKAGKRIYAATEDDERIVTARR